MRYLSHKQVVVSFALSLYKNDNTAQINNKTYTINSADTWEFKTLTFEANTLSGGAINDDNGLGFYVNWHLAAGSDYTGGGSLSGWTNYGGNTYWADGQATNVLFTTNSSTWQLTGCQLEVGDTATDFEHRTFADELLSCKRYFQLKNQNSEAVSSGVWLSNSNSLGYYPFEIEMRTTPTMSVSSADWGYGYEGGSSNATNDTSVFDNISPRGARMNINSWATNGSVGQGTFTQLGTDEYIHADAEL